MMKRKLKFFCIACSILFLGTVAAVAQTVQVSGVVTDQAGTPLAGVTVLVRGTQTGDITDSAGAYSLNAPSAASVISFFYVGYITAEETVGTRRVINVRLEEEVQAIGDVVVVGYGTRRAGEVTGSISTVSSEDIEKLAAVDVGELLRNVPGVTVLQPNTPGAQPRVRIRGIGTINDSSPLWVVDGVPGAPVNPNNVESMTVLKDAAASAIYGTRAANGVILVTTKSGSKNQPATVRVNMRTGYSHNGRSYDLLNTQEYGELLWLQFKHDGKAPANGLYGSGEFPVIPDYIFPNGAKEGSPEVNPDLYDDRLASEDGDSTYQITRADPVGPDWMKVISQNGLFYDLSLNVSGGSQSTTYSFQMGAMEEEGILKYTNFRRYNGQANINTDLAKWVRIGENISLSYQESRGTMSNNSESSPVSGTYRMPPIIPVYDIMGNFAGTNVGGGTGNGTNPLSTLYSNKDDLRRTARMNGIAYLQLTPLDGLTAKSQFGITLSAMHLKDINLIQRDRSERSDYDSVSNEMSFNRQWTWTNTVDYKHNFGKHSLTVLLGAEAISSRNTGFTASRQKYLSNDPHYMALNTGQQSRDNSSSMSEWSLFSIFSRLNYSFDNRYLLEAVVRRDGSSRFGANNKYGTFPAASFAWRVTEENFMTATRGWLSALKLRIGYGLTGNDRIDNYNSISSFEFNTGSSFYPIDGSNSSQGRLGFRQNRIGNANTRWETTATFDAGIDITLWRNLDVTFDVWQRRTTDMLYQKALPAIMGNASLPSTNVGEMMNRGFDIDITYRGRGLGGDLRYTISANVSHYKNKIINLTGNPDEFLEGGIARQVPYTRSQNGTAFPEFFGYIVDGIFQSDEEAKAWTPIFSPKGTYNRAGNFKFRNLNGDDIVDANDRTYIGSPHPKFVGGLNINLQYRGWDLNAELYGSYGNKMVNYVKRWIDFNQFSGNRSHDHLYKSWGSPHLKDNSKAKLPISVTDDSLSQVPSTAFLEDASYLRLRNVVLGYNFSRLLNMPRSQSLRLYMQLTNLLTWSKYSGLDPEVSSGGNSRSNSAGMGVDQGATPVSKRVLFGVTLGF